MNRKLLKSLTQRCTLFSPEQLHDMYMEALEIAGKYQSGIISGRRTYDRVSRTLFDPDSYFSWNPENAGRIGRRPMFLPSRRSYTRITKEAPILLKLYDDPEQIVPRKAGDIKRALYADLVEPASTKRRLFPPSPPSNRNTPELSCYSVRGGYDAYKPTESNVKGKSDVGQTRNVEPNSTEAQGVSEQSGNSDYTVSNNAQLVRRESSRQTVILSPVGPSVEETLAPARPRPSTEATLTPTPSSSVTVSKRSARLISSEKGHAGSRIPVKARSSDSVPSEEELQNLSDSVKPRKFKLFFPTEDSSPGSSPSCKQSSQASLPVTPMKDLFSLKRSSDQKADSEPMKTISDKSPREKTELFVSPSYTLKSTPGSGDYWDPPKSKLDSVSKDEESEDSMSEGSTPLQAWIRRKNELNKKKIFGKRHPAWETELSPQDVDRLLIGNERTGSPLKLGGNKSSMSNNANRFKSEQKAEYSPVQRSRAPIERGGIIGGRNLYAALHDVVPRSPIVENIDGKLYIIFPENPIRGVFSFKVRFILRLSIADFDEWQVLTIPGFPIEKEGGFGTLKFTAQRTDRRVVKFDTSALTNPRFGTNEVLANYDIREPFSLPIKVTNTKREALLSGFRMRYEIRMVNIFEPRPENALAVEYTAACVLDLDESSLWADEHTFFILINDGPAGDFEWFMNKKNVLLDMSLHTSQSLGQTKLKITCLKNDLKTPFLLRWQAVYDATFAGPLIPKLYSVSSDCIGLDETTHLRALLEDNNLKSRRKETVFLAPYGYPQSNQEKQEYLENDSRLTEVTKLAESDIKSQNLFEETIDGVRKVKRYFGDRIMWVGIILAILYLWHAPQYQQEPKEQVNRTVYPNQKTNVAHYCEMGMNTDMPKPNHAVEEISLTQSSKYPEGEEGDQSYLREEEELGGQSCVRNARATAEELEIVAHDGKEANVDPSSFIASQDIPSTSNERKSDGPVHDLTGPSSCSHEKSNKSSFRDSLDILLGWKKP